MRKPVAFILLLASFTAFSQNFKEEYDKFKNQSADSYAEFRRECNKKYADFLRQAWDTYSAIAPVKQPDDPVPSPPVIYDGPIVLPVIKPVMPPVPDLEPVNPPVLEPVNPPVLEPVTPGDTIIPLTPIDDMPVLVITPIMITSPVPEPQPLPIRPIKEQPDPNPDYRSFSFYDADYKVRMPEDATFKLADLSGESVADAWEFLSDGKLDNTIRDCLETRITKNLCDWAYIQMLDEFAKSVYGETNEATLLMAWLYCQSGYKMRLGVSDDNRLAMLFGSKHLIYDIPSFSMAGTSLYPYGTESKHMKISGAEFPGEQSLSLLIESEPFTGDELSDERNIKSRRYPEIDMNSQVKTPLIRFFDTYPTSAIGGNVMTRWAMYANTPLSKETKDRLYPRFRDEFEGLSDLDAVQRILNWIQTGLEYGYDNEIWGGDRAFFAEETLYYPYCDCEDRAILFSRLVRDLLNLDVALVYYPGHLAAAVGFNTEVKGDVIKVDNRDFVICDPTYIGAPVGRQMPDLDYGSAQAILLNR